MRGPPKELMDWIFFAFLTTCMVAGIGGMILVAILAIVGFGTRC